MRKATTDPASTPKTLIFPVFIPMQGCHGRCIYCDQNAITGVADATFDDTIRDAERFVQNHPGVAKQIAFYGGSFTALPQAKREELLNLFDSARDELTSYRVSTHPLYIDAEILSWCAAHGISTIELGIQDFHDRVLTSTGRGYTSSQALDACKLILENGFELGVQLMPGLPGRDEDSLKHNHSMLKALRPHVLRIYPCVVLRGTPLEKLFHAGSYTPLSLDEAIQQAADYQELADALCIRLIKLGIPSNLDPASVIAGPWHPAFGQLVRAELLVRSLEAQYPPGSHILLTKKHYALLRAHGLYYLNILRQRLKNCSLDVL